jgi:hypothetical protein
VGTIHCKCGHSFSDGEIPCPYEFHLLHDPAIENLTEKLIDLARNAGDPPVDVAYTLTDAAIYTYKCPYCGRLIVFWEGLQNRGTFYILDE